MSTIMQSVPSRDHYSRTAKILADSGRALSFTSAEAMLRSFQLDVRVGADVAASPCSQACLLTVVNTAARCFLGGVYVTGVPESPLLAKWPGCTTLGQAVTSLGGNFGQAAANSPQIIIGDATPAEPSSGLAIRPTFQGWRAGVATAASGVRLDERCGVEPAGVFAGALAVSEAFQHASESDRRAGFRQMGLSLWEPEPRLDWLDCDDGPAIECLPSRLWLIGLGHLGQAFLWTLGLLPYGEPRDVHLMLQDMDRLSTANLSTSPLTFERNVGEYKTRAMARWCELRGFNAKVCERKFAADFQVAADEPAVAVSGVDNLSARQSLEQAGFEAVVDAGLGTGPAGYLDMQIRTFPGPSPAEQIYSDQVLENLQLPDVPAYSAQLHEEHERCGLINLAGASVGACFVGCAASALTVAELIRMAMAQPSYAFFRSSLRDLKHRRTTASDSVRIVNRIGRAVLTNR